jgi:hypothetical protein
MSFGAANTPGAATRAAAKHANIVDVFVFMSFLGKAGQW